MARAREMTQDPRIEYLRSAIEDVGFSSERFDVVMSSLAFHYVEAFDQVCVRVHRWLAADGVFLFSVEHPVFTAKAKQDWCYGPDGERRHWPIDDYQQEGFRRTDWMADDVVKYHRTLATYVNTLISAGFRIIKVSEPTPSPEMLAQQPDLADESRRPMFLIISATKEQ